jgi:hypothetical protein
MKLPRYENETDEQYAIRNRIYRDKCNVEHRAYLARRKLKEQKAPVPAPVEETDPEIARLEKTLADAALEIKERRKQQRIENGTYRPPGRPPKNPTPEPPAPAPPAPEPPAPEPPAPEPPAPEPPAPEPVRLSAAERMEQIMIDDQFNLFKLIMADAEQSEREKFLRIMRMVRGMAPR